MRSGNNEKLLDVLAFSGLWAGVVAAGLTLASARALAPELHAKTLAATIGLAFAGTVVVYNIDRLRDLPRDLHTSPARSRFVERHRSWILGLTAAAGVLCLPLARLQAPGATALCGGVLALGLLHRRLKGRAGFKLVYVTLAWLTVVIGLPVVNARAGATRATDVAFAAAIYGAAIAANLIASDLRDRPGPGQRHQRVLRTAQILAAAGALLPVLARSPAWPLAAVPAAELAALIRFRAEERYGLVVVDGALLAGALGAILLFL